MGVYFSGKRLRRIEAHFLLAVVHSRKLHNDREVSSRHNRYGNQRPYDAEDLCRLICKAEPVVGFFIVPGLQMDNQIYRSLRFYSAYAVDVADIDDSDPAQLHIVADQFRCGADQGVPRF